MLKLAGNDLKRYISTEVDAGWVPRDFVESVGNYLQGVSHKVLAICGLRGTGKTVGILQAINPDNTLYLCGQKGDCITTDECMEILSSATQPVIVVDELTWIEGYEDIAAYLYTLVQNGSRVIISGTESITIESLKFGPLIHRVAIVHTTLFTYPEFCRVNKFKPSYDTCHKFIEIGGLFSEYIIRSYSEMDDYIRNAILENIANYMPNIDIARATIYTIFYYGICDNTASSVPSLCDNAISYAEFLDEFNIDPSIILRPNITNEISKILENAGIIVKVRDYRFQSRYRMYIVNPSISYQMVKCIYRLDSLPHRMYGLLFEGSCVCTIAASMPSGFELSYLAGRRQGQDFEIDFIASNGQCAYLFECKLSKNTKLPSSASLVKNVIEEVLADSDIEGRYVLYNGSEKAEIINNKEVFYTSDFDKILHFEFFNKSVKCEAGHCPPSCKTEKHKIREQETTKMTLFN